MKTFTTTATLNKKGKFYQHFGITPKLVSLYGDKVEDIVNITFKISDDQTVPAPNETSLSADYWGWYDNEMEDFSQMIYAKRFLLQMCFPYGIKASEDNGQGKAFRLEIIEVK